MKKAKQKNINQNKIFIYVIVMGIIRCEKVFAGILYFLVCLKLKWKYFNTERIELWKYFYFDRKQTRIIKNHSKNFSHAWYPFQ